MSAKIGFSMTKEMESKYMEKILSTEIKIESEKEMDSKSARI